MKILNIDSWKHKMKKYSEDLELDIQEVYQRFILEEFAHKISYSDYKEQFIIKGGFVVSTILGFETRMTRDIDLTYSSTIYSDDEIKAIINNVIKAPYDSVFNYTITNIKKAQKDDEFPGYIITIQASLDNTKFDIKLDIANNTLIYPEAIENNLSSLFSNTKINVYTYHLENIIAEKFETTLDRGEFNGRIRDLFDIYFLFTKSKTIIDKDILKTSILAVSEDRETFDNLKNYKKIKSNLLNSPIFNQNFIKYRDLQYPDSDLNLIDIMNVFDIIYEYIK